MKNTITGLLIIVFLAVYSVSLSIVNFSFEKKIENNICGLSIGSNLNNYRFHNGDSKSSNLDGTLFHITSESLLNNIDNNSFSDLFAVSQQTFSFGNSISSKFISRENQIPKDFFIEPVFVPS